MSNTTTAKTTKPTTKTPTPTPSHHSRPTLSFSLTVLLHRDGKMWIAQCLDRDVAAQGKSIEDVKQNFLQTLRTQIAFDLHDGREPLSGLPPAPERYTTRLGRKFIPDGIELPVCAPAVLLTARFLSAA